ncbi:GGDEF domain-containing protein [Ramlibacter sp. MAHUQ-53]
MAPTVEAGVGTGRLLAVMAVVVSLLFAVGIGLIAWDQRRVLSEAARMHDETLPQMRRHQQLARNLERLHEEGENVFASTSPEGRQQALFMVKLIAAHPSLVDDSRAREMAAQSQRLLQAAVERAEVDPAALGRHREAWRQQSRQLALLVDELFNDSVNLAAADLQRVSDRMEGARNKLYVVLPLFIATVLFLLWQVHRLLVRPLLGMNRVLSRLDTVDPALELERSPLREIAAVQAALRALRELLAQKEQSRVALEELASQDDLTGLLNRRKFMEMAQAEISRDHRHRRPVVVVMADIDQFKAINDTYGHAAGDRVLKAFAALLKGGLRETDVVGRIGGEEFALVLPEVAPEIAARLVERIRQQFAQRPIDLGEGRTLHATFSAGIGDASDVSLDAALRRADAALYEAKAQGRNRVQIAPG